MAIVLILYPFCILKPKDNQMPVRVILRYEKSYQEQLERVKFLFSIPAHPAGGKILAISTVKFIRINRILSKCTMGKF